MNTELCILTREYRRSWFNTYRSYIYLPSSVLCRVQLYHGTVSVNGRVVLSCPFPYWPWQPWHAGEQPRPTWARGKTRGPARCRCACTTTFGWSTKMTTTGRAVRWSRGASATSYMRMGGAARHISLSGMVATFPSNTHANTPPYLRASRVSGACLWRVRKVVCLPCPPLFVGISHTTSVPCISNLDAPYSHT